MDKRSHWSSRLLETQKKIDTLFEESRKTYSDPKARSELKIINEVIEEKLGEREKELKEKARQETLFLMENWHLIKRRFVNPLNEFLQRRVKKKFTETFVQRVIIVSGGLGIDNIEKAKSLGVKHFLAKPFDQKEFRGKVQKIYTILKARMS